jgi:hypothetical protein
MMRRLFTGIQDPALSSLDVASDPEAMSTLFRTVLPPRIGSRSDCTVASGEVLKYRRGKRCTIAYELECDLTVYVKLFYNERGERIKDKMQVLKRACGSRPLIPEPYGYLPNHRMLILEGISGEPLSDILHDCTGEADRRAATALSDLHSCGARLPKLWRLVDEVSVLTRRIDILGRNRPELHSPLLNLTTELWAREPSDLSSPAPLHRDFYPAQVIAQNGAIAFVDLDDSAMGDPLIDVANFMAHITLLSFRRFTDPDGLAKTRRAFLDAYRERNPHLETENLPFYEASTLIRLASLASDHGRMLEADILLGQARGILSLHHPT